MFSFFKRNKNKQPTPQWASFFNADEYAQFLERLNHYLEKEKIAYSLGNGEITIQDGSFGADQLGLVNLAQMCKQQPVRKWQSMITNHFNSLRENAVFQDEFTKKAHDFDFVKPYLVVRLYSKEYLSYIGDEAFIGKPVTDDIVAILAFDLPMAITNVKPEQTIQWNKTNEELFDWGLENARINNPVEIVTETIGEFNVRLVQGNHFFAPNTVLELHRHTGFVGTQGSLVGIPHRHGVLIYPIEHLQVVTAITTLIPLINGLYKEGPGAISPQLFWYYDNQFTTLPYELSNEKIQFYPPEPFLNMLNNLEDPAAS